MLRHLLFGAIILLAPVGDEGPGGAPPIPPAPPTPATPFAVFETNEALNKRLEQASRSALKREFGTDDIGTIKARIARGEELEAQEVERKKAAMTEAERLKADKEQAEAKARGLESDLAQERLQRHIANTCAAKGVKDVDYASFLIEKETAKLPEGQQLDVAAFLDEQLKNDTKKAALGITEAAPKVVADPATTVPKPGDPPPPPPKAGETGPAPDAMAMSPEAFNKHKQSLGLV